MTAHPHKINTTGGGNRGWTATASSKKDAVATVATNITCEWQLGKTQTLDDFRHHSRAGPITHRTTALGSILIYSFSHQSFHICLHARARPCPASYHSFTWFVNFFSRKEWHVVSDVHLGSDHNRQLSNSRAPWGLPFSSILAFKCLFIGNA